MSPPTQDLYRPTYVARGGQAGKITGLIRSTLGNGSLHQRGCTSKMPLLWRCEVRVGCHEKHTDSGRVK